MAVSRALLASLALLLSAAAALGGSLSAKGNYEFSSGGDKTYSGDITYYGAQNSRGFGHCSYHFSSFGNLPAFKGTPLAINNAQYTGVSVCGLCIMFRGTGRGSGGNPVKSDWQLGFVCDQCPECGFGALDKQVNGDGRWSGEWYPVQCPVGSSTFSYGYQGGNPWYRKLQVANARVPVAKVELFDGYTKGFKVLTATIDNYHEYHGDVFRTWNRCARARLTSVLGDTVEDEICCHQGTCTGKAQFPCNRDFPGCDRDSDAERVAVGRKRGPPPKQQKKQQG